MDMTYKLVPQGQEVAAEVHEQSVLRKVHNHCRVKNRLDQSENGGIYCEKPNGNSSDEGQ